MAGIKLELVFAGVLVIAIISILVLAVLNPSSKAPLNKGEEFEDFPPLPPDSTTGDFPPFPQDEPMRNSNPENTQVNPQSDLPLLPQ